MCESTTQLVQDLIDGWNAHDVDKVTSLYADDFEEEDIAAAGLHSGLAAVRVTMKLYLRAFPDLHIAAEQVVTQGNQIALSWILSGTHHGTLMHIPPTGRAVRVRGVSMITLAEGRIKRACRVWDLAGLLRTFGLLPELS
jgi:steroid delta-isomerase-like uncharacterized protein